MIEEKDISQEKERYYEARAKSVIKALLKRKINSQYAANRAEALTAVMEMIRPGATVARGDSSKAEGQSIDIPRHVPSEKEPLLFRDHCIIGNDLSDEPEVRLLQCLIVLPVAEDPIHDVQEVISGRPLHGPQW